MESECSKPSVPISIAREQQLIRLLMAYLITGLLFMVLPGTFLGVWSLFAISNAQSATSVPAAWIQAHGHAQLFGWIGSFILGIGFYSIPNLRRVSAWSFWAGSPGPSGQPGSRYAGSQTFIYCSGEYCCHCQQCFKFLLWCSSLRSQFRDTACRTS